MSLAEVSILNVHSTTETIVQCIERSGNFNANPCSPVHSDQDEKKHTQLCKRQPRRRVSGVEGPGAE